MSKSGDRGLFIGYKSQKMTERHAVHMLAPPACKPTGSLRAGSAARANPPFDNRYSAVLPVKEFAAPVTIIGI